MPVDSRFGSRGHMVQRLREKVVERPYACDYRRKRRGYRRIARVRPVLLSAIQDVAVNLRVKRGLHLRRRARKVNDIAAMGDTIHLKAVRLKPRRDFLDILIGCAELLAELVR